MIRNLEYVGSVYAPREDETNYHRGGSAALENNLCCLNHIGQVVADADAEDRLQPRKRRLRRKISTEEAGDNNQFRFVADGYPERAWPKRWHGCTAPAPGYLGSNVYADECLRNVLRWLADCGRRRALRRRIALAPGWF